jgi:hypothetical protein
MTDNGSARTIDVLWPGSSQEPGQALTDGWSFGTRKRMFGPRTPQLPIEQRQRSASANFDSWTIEPQRRVDVSQTRPQMTPERSLGKRGFAPLYQWEGVVEQINGTGFRARLQPANPSEREGAGIEIADFDYADLSTDSDKALVSEGAVFYWTVGRVRNAAGTVYNTSLIRFRRVPASTPYASREAAHEARALLADL